MTINDIMKKSEYYNFKLSNAVYDEESDTTTLTVLYSNEQKPTDEQKESLRHEVSSVLGDDVKCRVKFSQSYIDPDILFAKLIEFEDKDYPYLKDFAQKDDIALKFQDGEVNITINCDKDMKTILESAKFAEAFKKFLQDDLIEDVFISLNPCKTSSSKLGQEKLSYKEELTQIIEKEHELNKVQIDEIVNVVGKLITKPACFIKDINKAEEVVIAGTMQNPVFSKYVPKAHRNEENPVQKDKLSFVLKDASGEINVVMFPSPVDVEKLAKIPEGTEVVISGDWNDFMGSTSIIAKALSTCKVLTKEVKYIWREPIKEYKTVIPQPMEDLQQMSLFSVFDQKPNDYWKDGKEVVVFDFETTGLNADTCQIIEIGAVKVRNGSLVETFSTLINPHQKLDPEIVNLTGITDDMLVFAPNLEDVLPDFHKFVQNAVLSAYNIGFDIRFLLNAGKKFRFKFDNEQIDTLALVRQKVPSLPNYKLSSAVKALDITLNDAHRAINDAVATAKVFVKLI